MKSLHVATDIYDEAYNNHRFPGEGHIRALMAYLPQTAHFTHVDAAGRFQGSQEALDVCRRFGFAKA